MDKSISVETDQKPLVPLLSTATLDQLPSTIQRFKMGLTTFHFEEVNDVPGKMNITNALSRVQARSQAMKLTIDEDENHPHIGSLISSLPA